MHKFFLLFLLFVISAVPGFGWVEIGHMAVATIAYERLDPDVKREVDRLTEKFGQNSALPQDFISSSCWVDSLSDSNLISFPKWHRSPLPYDPENRLSDEEVSEIETSLKDNDLIFTIQESIKILENPSSSDWEKGFALRVLAHMVADLHQPLHAASLYNSFFLNGDKSGTQFPILIEGNRGKITNLHAYWNALCGLGIESYKPPLDEKGVRHLEELVKLVTSSFPEKFFIDGEIDNLDPHHWRAESYEFAKKYAYNGITPGSAPSESYTVRGQAASGHQITLAGYRLARLLNKTLKAPSSLSRP